jgi:hypothetical protein
MCVQVPSSEAVPAEGAWSPRARRNSPEGVLRPRARRTLPEGASRPRTRRTPLVGASNPRARRTPPEGAFVVPPWWAAGATRVVIVSRMCALASWVSPCFASFAGFKRVSPSYLGGPLWLSPTHSHKLCLQCTTYGKCGLISNFRTILTPIRTWTQTWA